MDELQDVLKDLRDIHEPDPLSFWPPALGWWIVLLAIVLLIILLLQWRHRHKHAPKFKKLADDKLKNIVTNYEIQRNGHKTAIEISELIRKIIVLTDSQLNVAGKINQDWLVYLDAKSRTDLFTKGAGHILITAVYQKESDIDVEELITATRMLIKNV